MCLTEKYDFLQGVQSNEQFAVLTLKIVHFWSAVLHIAIRTVVLRKTAQGCSRKMCTCVKWRPAKSPFRKTAQHSKCAHTLLVIQGKSSWTGMNPSHPGHPCDGGSHSCHSRLHLLLAGAFPPAQAEEIAVQACCCAHCGLTSMTSRQDTRTWNITSVTTP